jgi:hypothetical protein
MLWWWDTYIEPMDLFYHYKGISSFFKDEAPVIETMKPAKRERHDGIEVFSLKSDDRILYWIRDIDYSLKGFVDKGFAVGLKNVTYEHLSGITFPVRDISAGVYRIEQWDTVTGEIISSNEAALSPSSSIQLSSFTKDIAIKLIKLES